MDSKTVKIKQSSSDNRGEDDHMSETAYALIDDYKKSDSMVADERPHFDITGNKTKLFERPISPPGPKIDISHKEHSQQTPTMPGNRVRPPSHGQGEKIRRSMIKILRSKIYLTRSVFT